MRYLVHADLDKPVTKDNYFTEIKAQLFSHFHMMQEVKKSFGFLRSSMNLISH